MRKVVLGLGISLDGYIARLDGSVDFLFMPKDYSMSPFFATIDTAILGRKTFDVGQKMGGFSGQGGSIKYYVCSRSEPPGERHSVTFTNETPQSLVEKIRRQPGKNIWHMGGGELARAFLQHDLIDELHIGIVPVLLGEGLPLFPSGFPQSQWTLLENKSFSKGLLSLKYERNRSRSTSVAPPKTKSKQKSKRK
jgi:dihydrofolate reductase